MNEQREFSLKDMISIIYRYKYIILFITSLSFLVAFVIAFYKPNIYKASSTVQIEKEPKPTIQPGDVLAGILNISSTSNLNTQKEIIKSRFLVQKVIEKLRLNQEFTAFDSFGKKHFFYKDEPLDISIKSSNNLFLTLIPKTQTSFLLKVQGANKDGTPINFSKEYRYDTPIQREGIELLVKKRANKTLDMKEYHINYYNPSYLANSISNNKLTVEDVGKDTTILKISYVDTIPKRAQEFVNFLTKIYMEQNLKNKTKEITFTLDFINKQLQKIQANIKDASMRLEDFKKKSNTINIKESIKELSKKLAEYENEKNILEFKVDALKKIARQIKKGTRLDSITLAGTGLDNQTIGNLVSQLQDALIKRQFLLKDYTYAHPEVKKVSAKIAQLKRMIRKSIINLLQNLEYRKKMLEQKLALLNRKLKNLSKNEQNFVNLERSFLLNSKFYSYLLEKKTEAEIKKAATINRNRVLDFAVLPDTPIAPKRKSIYLIGTTFGLIVGLIIAFVLYMLNHKVESVDDVEKSLKKKQIVGAIPLSKRFKYKKYIKEEESLLNNLEADVVDEFRNLRTNVSFLLDFNKGGIICVSSTISREGKTFIATALAESIERVGKNVLIIDANLNEPTLHRVFHISNEKGLSDYLRGKEFSIAATIQRKHGLYILPTGKKVVNGSELIASQHFLNLLEHLRRVYDVIIIDTPSFTKASETKTIMRYSDLILYVVRMDFSKKEYLKIVNELVDIANIGIVLNGLKDIRDKFKYNMLTIKNFKKDSK